MEQYRTFFKFICIVSRGGQYWAWYKTTQYRTVLFKKKINNSQILNVFSATTPRTWGYQTFCKEADYCEIAYKKLLPEGKM